MLKEKENKDDILDLENLDFRKKSKSIYVKGNKYLLIYFKNYRPTNKTANKIA
jgi:hypothetical protein